MCVYVYIHHTYIIYIYILIFIHATQSMVNKELPFTRCVFFRCYSGTPARASPLPECFRVYSAVLPFTPGVVIDFYFDPFSLSLSLSLQSWRWVQTSNQYTGYRKLEPIIEVPIHT